MRWKDRNAVTMEMALALIFIIAIVFLFLVLIATRVQAESCLTVDLQPSDVINNYDGDTYTVSMGPLGLWRIREEGIDTPERNKKQPGWQEAQEFTRNWLEAGPFQLKTCFQLTLGRMVGSASRNGETLADALKQAGHEKHK